MFFLSTGIIWSVTYWFIIFYIITFYSIILYILPQVKNWTLTNFQNKTHPTIYTSTINLNMLLFIPIYFILLINFSWTSSSISVWFGHIIFTSLQHKFVFISCFFFFLFLFVLTSNFFWGSREISDFYISCLNFYLWTTFLFFSNSIFCVIFFIELLSTLIFLVVISSVFSSTFFYSNIEFNVGTYLSSQFATSYFKGILFFFWMSLLASLSFFLFLIFFTIKFFSLDWNFMEFITIYLITSSSLLSFYSFMLVWIFLIFCIFLKCGLVPFYFWKPVFFRSLPIHVLFFYVVYFYFFIFLFFILFFLFYLNEIFYMFILLFNFFLIIGFIFLFSLLTEAYYIKIFLALSSILNTLFVFIIFSSITCNFFLFFF